MAWIYLAESEGSPKAWQTGSKQLPTVRTMTTPKLYSSLAWSEERLTQLLSGMTLQHCEQDFFPRLILSPEDSLARISALQAAVQAWKVSEADFFSRSCGWPKKQSPNSYSLRMSPQSELEVPAELQKNWPQSGMIVDGILYPLKKLVRTIREKDGSAWPTPQGRDHFPAHSPVYIQAKINQGHGMANLNDAVSGNHPRWPTPRAQSATGSGPSRVGNRMDLQTAVFWRSPQARDGDARGPSSPEKRVEQGHSVSLHDQVGGQLNPAWVEWLMGYLCGTTELEPLVIPWYQSKSKRRSKNSRG